MFRLWVLYAVLVGVPIFCCNLGKAQTGTGIAGSGPQTGTGIRWWASNGNRNCRWWASNGNGNCRWWPSNWNRNCMWCTSSDADPAEIVAKALLCFNGKYIYSSCEEAYRLTETGELHVPSVYVDSYCSGSCLLETLLVLNCIEDIMKNFVFYNKATIEDIQDTIEAQCSYGPERGKFDVSEHLQAEETVHSRLQTRFC